MSFQMVAYGKLKTSVIDSIRAVLQKHNKDLINIDESISQLDHARRIHCQLLRKYLVLLDASIAAASNESEVVKAVNEATVVLNAVVYDIRIQIEGEWGNSILKISLINSLELSTANTPSDSELVIMYDNLSKFLYEKTYIKGMPDNGYVPGHPFSSESIKGYSVEENLRRITRIIFDLRMKSINGAEASKSKSKGLLGGLFGGSSSATALPRGGATATSSAAEPRF